MEDETNKVIRQGQIWEWNKYKIYKIPYNEHCLAQKLANNV